MSTTTVAAFFLSGAAALLFETLWFRQAGFVVGNTVWASSLVTAAFMAGLATGNLAALRTGWRVGRPLRVFAALEVVVAATGLSLVLLLPRLGGVFAPLLSSLAGTAALDAARVAGTFVLLIAPACAMGATLPVLARSLGARDANFGRLLGRLYGWNTLGAVAGALLGEWFLIQRLGVGGTGLVAAAMDLVAAGCALVLDRRLAALPPASRPASRLPSAGVRIVAAAFLAGAILLALEVVWFRFLLLFVWASTGTFAIMLAIVLLGIGCGGVLAAAWLGRRPDDARQAGLIAVAAAAAGVAGYALFDRVLPAPGGMLREFGETLRVSAWLMLPVCAASGALFTFLGHRLRAVAEEDALSAGLLTFANTLGAMFGSLLAGFLLLPFLGVEPSLLLLACGYGAVVALVPPRGARTRLAGLAVLAGALALFPWGAMRSRYVQRLETQWHENERYRIAAVSEGLGETVFLLRKDAFGQPLVWRLLTNGMGMSTTDYRARRYMGLYAWLPVALHPRPRSALLISYGLGNTARALAATDTLEAIDVVDVSADVLKMSSLVWSGPGENPLRDRRLRVHIEDGRFFLLTSRRQFDVITGEPPPPKAAGIVNLYSREYFELVHERLAQGGIATYWLPVLHLEPREAFAVVGGFCDAFADCSLWSGFGHEWMLVGTKGALGPGSARRFARQWHDPAVAPHLAAAGLPSPASLGATFLADAAQLAEITAGVAPVVDDWPYRLDPRRSAMQGAPEYARLMDAGGARERFRASDFVRRLWPEEWIAPTLDAFAAQAVMNRQAWGTELVVPEGDLETLEAALASGNEVLALWALGTSVEEQALAARASETGFEGLELVEVQGLGALARRQFGDAEARLAAVEPHAAHAARIRRWRILAAGLAGDQPKVGELLGSAGPLRAAAAADEQAAWQWLARRFGPGPG